MQPSERVNQLERTLQLSRQESMDLRVALVSLLEASEAAITFMRAEHGAGSPLVIDALAAHHKARVALGVLKAHTLPGEDVRQP